MKTLFVGRKLIELDRVDSTNNYAQELSAQEFIPDGTLIWAHEQYNGRGQRDATWSSLAHLNFTGSYILMPKLSVEEHFYLTKMTSLAVKQMVCALIGKNLEGRVKIKWPNDILVDNQKVAGILIENSVRGFDIGQSIIGIGLNINQTEFDEYLPNATSLSKLTGKTFQMTECVDLLCEELEKKYLLLKNRRLDWLDSHYLADLFRINTWAEYKTENTLFEGKLIGVKESGLVAIALRDGSEQTFNLKEVSFVI